MATLIKKKGLNGIMVLLEIIDLLSKTKEYALLASPGFISQQDVKERTKITSIVRYFRQF